MMGLKWVRQFCQQARYILKTDDDAFNVPQRFIDYLIGIESARSVDRFLGGYCFTVCLITPTNAWASQWQI